MALLATGVLPHAKADDGSSWLSHDAPTLNKVIELGGNVTPDSHNTDCATSGYALPDFSIRWVCNFLSPLGTLNEEGDLQVGVNKYVPLYGPDTVSTFLPSPDPSVAVVSLRSPQIGNNIGIYHHLSKSALTKVVGDSRTYYYVAQQPDAILRDPITHQALAISTPSIAYSANGQWMAANVPHTGLLRVNLADMSTKLFAAPVEPDWFLGVSSPPMAITNDGRFVAANTDAFGTGTLHMYDLTTCDDQLHVVSEHSWCNGRDIWQGKTLAGEVKGAGILSQQADLQDPVHIRFVDDQTISFNARYAVQTGQVYKAANFVATAPGGVQHKIGLLGLGDSYISGQGTFEYMNGTDTPTNPCHLSRLSYPFILGAQNFNSNNSVACSGATTDKLIGKDPNFLGQVTDKVKASDRDRNSILTTFQPGYIYQQEFASTYKPEAMLLSVGGDDIGFADIVRSCVANAGGGTCYDTYEDRAELVNEINSTYGKLVDTYQTLREQSGGARLYVVGYPQVAKVGGDCGVNVHLNSDEIAFSAELIDYLDGVVKKAAETAGVFYVDTQHAFDGHRLCESGDKAMNGLTAGKDAGVKVLGKTVNIIGAESYHPTQLGYRLLAQTIAAQTSNLSTAMPSQTLFAAPVLATASDILKGMPSTGRSMNQVTNDASMSDGFVVRGDSMQVSVDGLSMQLQPSSRYQIVLHSTPVLLEEGGLDADGNVSVTAHIPADTQPGYHTLHVYGTNMAGDPVDIQKVIYVAASANDYDGDGVPNSANACMIVSASGQDADADGIDDACDAEISTTAQISGHITINQPASAANVSMTSDSPGVSTVDAANNGTVLGDIVSSSRAPQKRSTSEKVNTPKLYRLDWLNVAEAGMGITVLLTVLRHTLRQQ